MEILKLRDAKELRAGTARWFHEKWGVPESAYAESIAACQEGAAAVPQWYVVAERGHIIAGAGVISNDFHNRPDLTPNLCALFVDEVYCGRGIAGELGGGGERGITFRVPSALLLSPRLARRTSAPPQRTVMAPSFRYCAFAW